MKNTSPVQFLSLFIIPMLFNLVEVNSSVYFPNEITPTKITTSGFPKCSNSHLPIPEQDLWIKENEEHPLSN